MSPDKQAKERAICAIFLKAFNKGKSFAHEFERFENPNMMELDCICSGWLCVEITQAVYSERVKEEEEVAISDKSKRNFVSHVKKLSPGRFLTSLVNPDIMLHENIIACISKKTAKNYRIPEWSALILAIYIGDLGMTNLKDVRNIPVHARGVLGKWQKIWIVDRKKATKFL